MTLADTVARNLIVSGVASLSSGPRPALAANKIDVKRNQTPVNVNGAAKLNWKKSLPTISPQSLANWESIEENNEINEIVVNRISILTLSIEVEAGNVDVADAGEDASILLGIVLDDAVAAGDVKSFEHRPRLIQIHLVVVVAVIAFPSGLVDVFETRNPAMVPVVVVVPAAPHRIDHRCPPTEASIRGGGRWSETSFIWW
jgi:hypothetical protein